MSEELTLAKAMVVLIGAAALVSCASADAHLHAGQHALAAGAWQQCIDELERFLEDADCESHGCLSARMDIAECRLRLGEPTRAFFALEDARHAARQPLPAEWSA